MLVGGAGPVGVTLANLLGTYGTHLVPERSPAILDYPRGGPGRQGMRTFRARQRDLTIWCAT